MCASARRSSKLAKCTWRRRGPRSAGSPWGVLSRGVIRAMRRATRRGWWAMPPGVPQPYPPAVEGVQGFRASSVRRHWRWAPRLSHSTGGHAARALARGTCARSHTRLACFRAHVSLAWLSKNTCMTSGLRLELIASVRRHTACAALLAHEDVRDCGLPPTSRENRNLPGDDRSRSCGANAPSRTRRLSLASHLTFGRDLFFRSARSTRTSVIATLSCQVQEDSETGQSDTDPTKGSC